MTVTVRFAPSPTGFLHIGGARTALFNWLFARHHSGVFRLRIEDTDRQRSTPEAMEAIVDGLEWLGMNWDGEIVHQFANAARHAAVVREMLVAGRAYRCYMSPAELEAMREQARAERRSVRIDSPWRDRDPADAPPGIDPVIRLKAPQEGATMIRDLVQGEVTVANSELDDLILLRADGTPTYNLSVVVDDHDMGISHVIRGDDHLRNAFRQTEIYRAAGWDVPEFAHIPLIHDAAGLKMSKRRGTVAVGAYRDLGYLPEGLRNYLLRLGWSHGDDEIISTDDAVRWFDIVPPEKTADANVRELLERPMSDFPDTRGKHPNGVVGRSPARFDLAKLNSINAHYIKETDDTRLVSLLGPFIGRTLTPGDRLRLLRAMPGLKPRAKTLREMAASAILLLEPAPSPDDTAAALIDQDLEKTFQIVSLPGSHAGTPSSGGLLPQIRNVLASVSLEEWPKDSLSPTALSGPLRKLATEQAISFGIIAHLLGAALIGRKDTPGLYVVLMALGRDEVLRRIDTALARGNSA